jgi:hypothetical protein
MTLDEFIDNLARVRDQFEWGLEPNVAWYGDGRVAPRAWLRARPRTGIARGAILEPVGAVCYALTGKAYGEKSRESASLELGLEPNAAAEIGAAADARTWDGGSGLRKPVPHLQAIRGQLLETVGLGRPVVAIHD